MAIEDVTHPDYSPVTLPPLRVSQPNSVDEYSLDAPQSLPDLVASFNGNKYEFLVHLMEHPEASFAECYRAAGVGEKAYYRWRATDKRFVAAQTRIVALKGDIKKELALVAFKAAAPNVARKMVEHALSDARDAQRAREKVLEAAGVLRKDGDLPDGVESIDVMAMRMIRRRGGLG